MLRSLLAVVAVAVHEANFLMFVPVLGFDLFLSARAQQLPRPAVRAGAAMVPAALAAWYLGNARTACDPAQAIAYFQAKAANFPIRRDAVETLCRAGAENVQFMLHKAWSSPVKSGSLLVILVAVCPSAIYNLWLAARCMGGRTPPVAACVLACAAPLALVLLGADFVRFASLLQLTSLLALLSVARHAGLPPGGTLTPGSLAKFALVALISFQLGSSLELTDDAPMAKFPYQQKLERLIAVLEGDIPLLVLPRF
jgi:hypothetical protein